MSHRCTECRAIAVESAGTVCLACWYWVAAGAQRIAVVLPTPEALRERICFECQGAGYHEGWVNGSMSPTCASCGGSGSAPEPAPPAPVTHYEGLVDGWPGLPRGPITFDRSFARPSS